MARILVIDDEYPVRAMLGKVLTEAGYEVVDASNGMEGIDRYRQDPGADQFTAKMHGRKS